MIEFEMHESLNQETIDKLWNQNICMDDWDYVLFVEEEYQNKFVKENDYLTPISYEVEGLLHGCCDNKWYKVNDFIGRKGMLGVAYHS